MSRVRAWAAQGSGAPLAPFDYDPGPLGSDEVEIAVEHCALCHSDLSVLDNEWGNSAYPLVPGHEVVGHIFAVGEHAKGLRVGQRVGVGWNAGSCMHCRFCLSGDQHLCPAVQVTVIGHHGGFAERLRAHWAWAIPIPEGLDPSSTGPLLCAGITVFNPLQRLGIRPTARTGVVGIGGLGHLAVKFLRAWGCEVTAFASSPSKFDEARSFGAHRVLSTRDADAIRTTARSLDLLLVTVSVSMDWDALIATLAPHGRLHIVGSVQQPIPVRAMHLIVPERSVSGSPTGSPVDIATMLDFADRHRIAPQVKHFPMSRVNDAVAHLRAGNARYRIVLDNDFTTA